MAGRDLTSRASFTQSPDRDTWVDSNFTHQPYQRPNSSISSAKSRNIQRAGALPKPGDKILLVPIASIAVGKTTLANSIGRSFSIGHIQNDDLTHQRGFPKAQQFSSAIVQEFVAGRTIVFADRNNHQFQHRKNLINDVRGGLRRALPEANLFVVALHWTWAKERTREFVARSIERVRARGTNHQTLRDDGKTNVEKIIRSFVYDRDSLNLSHPSDSGIQRVITLQAFHETEVSANVVKRELTKLLDIIDGKQGLKPLYYGLKCRTNIAGLIADLAATGSAEAPDDGKPDESHTIPGTLARAFNSLSSVRRVQEEHHVTLVYLGYSRHESKLSQAQRDVAAYCETRLNQVFELTFNRIYWKTDLLMAIPVNLPEGLMCANEHPHITVGTFSKYIRPVQSNQLIADVMNGEGSCGVWWAGKEVKVEAVMFACYR